jgi:hypothetical protein
MSVTAEMQTHMAGRKRKQVSYVELNEEDEFPEQEEICKKKWKADIENGDSALLASTLPTSALSPKKTSKRKSKSTNDGDGDSKAQQEEKRLRQYVVVPSEFRLLCWAPLIVRSGSVRSRLSHIWRSRQGHSRSDLPSRIVSAVVLMRYPRRRY